MFISWWKSCHRQTDTGESDIKRVQKKIIHIDKFLIERITVLCAFLTFGRLLIHLGTTFNISIILKLHTVA